MRLTLRTLLAYLDKTLEPQDAEVLRRKLSESNYATGLVQRIRKTLGNRDLAAPSPQAVGPIEEANVISEYLDSTLPTEQVAEIERAYLESDPHLAEVAACHQILTLVLGRKAEVSPELRQRIYELPEKNVEEIAAAAGSFSSVSIPEQLPLGSGQDAILTAESESSSATGRRVQPVGKGDSGVSDAPTRIRQTAVGDSSASKRKPVIAGGSPRKDHSPTALYGGRIRSSRIAPWLVSLALAGVLLFALSRIFAPLLSPDRLATSAVDPTVGVDGGGDAASQSSPLDTANVGTANLGEPQGGAAATRNPDGLRPSAATTQTTELVPAGEPQPDDGEALLDADAPPLPAGASFVESLPAPEAVPAPEPAAAEQTPGPAVMVMPKSSASDSAGSAAEALQAPAARRGGAEPVSPDMTAGEDLATPDTPPTAISGNPSEATSVGSAAGKGGETLAAPDIVAAQPAAATRAEVATVGPEPTLMTAQIDSNGNGQWVRLSAGMPVVEGVTVGVRADFPRGNGIAQRRDGDHGRSNANSLDET